MSAADHDTKLLLQQIYDTAYDAIFVIDPSADHIIDANTRALTLLGYSRTELFETPISQIHPKEMPQFTEACQRVIADGVHRTDDLHCTTKAGKNIPVDIAFSTLDLDGRQLILAVVRDITERKIREQELHDALTTVEQLKARLSAENSYLQAEINTQHNTSEMVSESPLFREVLTRVASIAKTQAPVLVTGETGVGKELIARAIHAQSHRRDRPLIKVNCAAISSTLMDHELFGYEREDLACGRPDKPGRF